MSDASLSVEQLNDYYGAIHPTSIWKYISTDSSFLCVIKTLLLKEKYLGFLNVGYGLCNPLDLLKFSFDCDWFKSLKLLENFIK